MTRSKYISLLLAVVLIFTTLVMPFSAEAANLSGLNKHQKYYLRLIGSLARADYYETDVLASVTVAQAIYEGGWGSYSLPVGGNNLFGIKAYNTWDGKVYDQIGNMLYGSYSDFLLSLGQIRSTEISAWRAHDNWADSVRVHSQLFLEGSNYAPVVGEKNYKNAFRYIVNGGYCSDNGYVETAIDILEKYGCDEYDDITADSDGIVALTADKDRIYMDKGETYTLNITYYPSGKTPSSVTFKSDNTAVATVDKNGKITAVAHGTAFITATLANGREACCIVYVDCDATIIDQNVTVRKSASASASDLGSIPRGYPVKIMSDVSYTDDKGNEYVRIKGYTKDEKLVEGYVLAEYVYQKKRNVSSITVVKDDLTLTVGQQYTVVASVAPADAVDRELVWTSSDASVASVNAKGVITANKKGNATITAAASGGAKRTLTVTVASSAKKYRALVTATDSLRVRSAAAWSAGSAGSVDFLSEITVDGEPKGYWYQISGKTSGGKAVSGYVPSIYIMLIPEGESVKYSTATANLTVYENANSTSKNVGSITSNTKIAVIGYEKNGWSYVVGKNTSGDGIYGYARLDGSSEILGGIGDMGDGSSVSGWYGIVTSDTELNVREKASSSASVVGKFKSGAQIVITAEEKGWYKVVGTSTSGATIQGYASAEFIDVLYNATVINIDDSLNVRAQPSTSADIIGKLYNGNKITVIGENLGGWYKIETSSLSGYCSADYIRIDGKITTEVSSGTTPSGKGDFSITNSKLYITDGILYGVSEDTTVAQLLNSFTGNVTILDSNDKKLANTALVGTGAKISVTKDGKTTIVATIAVMGDVNGDGDVTSLDYILVKRCFLNTYKLEDVYLQAALVSGGEYLSVVDYIMVKRIYFGTYRI